MSMTIRPSARRDFLKTAALGAAAFAVPVGFAAPAAAAETPAQGGGFYRFKIGDIAATIASDGAGPFPVWPILASNASEAEVKAALEAHFISSVTPNITSNILCLDTGKERVLIDGGVGGAFGPTFGKASENLRRAGIEPASITTVVISHAHVDHIHGLLDADGKPVYPNARYVIVEDEWRYWSSPDAERAVMASKLPDDLKKGLLGSVRRTFPVIEAKTERVKAGAEVTTGITLVPAPGHTPAHSAVLVSSGNAQLLHIVDVAHSFVTSFEHPEWTPLVDAQPDVAVATRRRVLDRAAADKTFVLGYHLPFPALGHVRASGGAFAWEPAPWEWG